MKKSSYVISFLVLIMVGCTQKPAEVVHKQSGIYKPNYTETYVESPDGKIARSLRGRNDSTKAQEISIIKNDAMGDISKTSYYTVKSGDSLWTISRKYDMNVPQLVALNGLKKPYNIRPGQRLRVSGTTNSVNVRDTSDNEKIVISSYKVKSGDNLTKIANQFGMGKTELAELNNLEKPYNLRVGQKLKVKKIQNSSSESDTITDSSKNGIYIVKSGDSLSSIAEKNNMSLGEIAELNNISKPYSIRIGQKLKVSRDVVVVKDTSNPVRQTKSTASSTPKNQNVVRQNRKNSFIWPVKGEVISSFGNKPNGLYNDGINISASKGANFKATEDGVVAYVGNELRGYGTIVLIKHNDNWISAYAHCGSVKVARGDRVERGQVIGTVGQTGNVSSPQLYFSLRSGREAVDPIKYLE